MPRNEALVCDAFEEADTEFYGLDIQWTSATASTDTNELRKRVLVDSAKKPIDELLKQRNRLILVGLGGRHPHVDQWLVKVGKINLKDEDFGNGVKQYITLEGTLPCRASAGFTTKEMQATPKIAKFIATVDVGDYLLVSGYLETHDEQMQPLENAIEWGSPLWGPFGGLWRGAIRDPSLKFNVASMTTPG